MKQIIIIVPSLRATQFTSTINKKEIDLLIVGVVPSSRENQCDLFAYKPFKVMKINTM